MFTSVKYVCAFSFLAATLSGCMAPVGNSHGDPTAVTEGKTKPQDECADCPVEGSGDDGAGGEDPGGGEEGWGEGTGTSEPDPPGTEDMGDGTWGCETYEACQQLVKQGKCHRIASGKVGQGFICT